MALKNQYTQEVYGKQLVFLDAYFQVTYLSGDKNNIGVILTIYDGIQKNNVIDQKNYTFKPDISFNSHNYHRQFYEYAKTLPEFEGATDVFEDEQVII